MDNKIILDIKNSDEKSLYLIIDKYTAYLFTVARNFSKGYLSEEDIEEVVSDVFVSLWNNRENLCEDKSLKPYLSMIAKNKIKNIFRSMKDIKLEMLDKKMISEDFLEKYEQKMAMEVIYETLDRLSDSQRNVFIRFYFYGESISNISEKTKLSISNTKTMLHRTRKLMKNILTERGFK